MNSSIMAFALAISGATAALAQDTWDVDHQTARLAFMFAIGDATATGTFGDWSADIQFDPTHPGESFVRVDVDMASVSVDDPRAQAVDDAAWLATSDHPTAVFEATGFDLSAGNRLSVDGTLTLKGVQAPLTLTGTLRLEGKTAMADLSGSILRQSHDIGLGQDAVSSDVTVRTTFTAYRTSQTDQ